MGRNGALGYPIHCKVIMPKLRSRPIDFQETWHCSFCQLLKVQNVTETSGARAPGAILESERKTAEMAPPPEYSPPAAGRCGERRPDGLSSRPAIGAKGRNRGQGCRGMDPWAGKRPEPWPRVPWDGPLGREKARQEWWPAE